MKLLITGGFGYVGGRLAQSLSAQARYEIFLGSRQRSEPPSWLPHAQVVQTQWDSTTALEKICSDADAIVHTAGMNAQDCQADYVEALEFNGVSTARLVQAAVRQRVKRFIYLSSAHVYGNSLTGVITEETCPTSLHAYATSHRAGEDAVRSVNQRAEIEGIVVRLSNAYGAPVHRDVNSWMLLVNDLCRQAASKGRMVLRSTGRQRRDFVTLTDTCRAISHLLTVPMNEFADGLFNAGGEWSPTVLEMTELIAHRFQTLTNQRPEILRPPDDGTESSDLLEYSIAKLKRTGFSLSGGEVVNQEIDALIQFCLAHRA